MKHQSMTLNIRYDAPEEVWNKMPDIYRQMEGWLEPEDARPGVPYWFSTDENEKHICSSKD